MQGTRYNLGVQTDSPSTEPTPALYALREPIVLGTLCGLASAVGYTAANACLRAVANCDPVWVSFAKALPTVALFGPVLLVRLLSGREALPAWAPLRVLLLSAIVSQLLGNVIFQWSLGVIGMALTVPLTLGAMIAGAALMGRLWLHEPVTVSMAASMAVLIAAVFVLSSGARQAADPSAPPAGQLRAEQSVSGSVQSTRAVSPAAPGEPAVPVLWGVVAACLSGLAYAYLGVAIRAVVRDALSLWMTTVAVTLTGLVTLGSLGLAMPGLSAWQTTTGPELAMMVAAGLFNALAFLALTKALQLVPVAHVNVLNASQAALGAMAGVLFFAETSSWQLWLGVGLTALGLLMMRRPTSIAQRVGPGREVTINVPSRGDATGGWRVDRNALPTPPAGCQATGRSPAIGWRPAARDHSAEWHHPDPARGHGSTRQMGFRAFSSHHLPRHPAGCSCQSAPIAAGGRSCISRAQGREKATKSVVKYFQQCPYNLFPKSLSGS